MIELTSPELGKELYNLSGWEPPFSTFVGDTYTNMQYDVGYLLDKMVERKTGLTLYHVHSTMQWECFYAGKFFEYGTDTQHWEYQDSNPANAAARLAIDMFKKGVFKK